jgi:hypothetical protein
MGGFGSGRHHRWHKRTVVEDCLRLSLKRLFKQGTLVEGRYTSGSLTWRNGSKDVLGSILYEADMQNSEAATFIASFSYNKAPMVKRIVRMHYTVPHYGGRRWWFVCPVTGKRCSHLYIREGVVASRVAFNLPYQTQSEREIDRMCTKAWRMRELKGIKDEMRPKGMHRKTYIEVMHASDTLLDDAFALAAIHFAPKQ